MSKKLKTDFNNISLGVKKQLESKNELPETNSLQERIWQALINPARAVEVRGWVNKHKESAVLMKGNRGETMLHWAVMSEYGLLLDLILSGIDPNAVDNEGLTPMDWLVNRFWVAVVSKKLGLNNEGILKIKAQTEELGSLLWYKNGRTGKNHDALIPGDAWVRGGAWTLLSAMYETDGTESMKNWFEDKRSVLHSWILSEETTEKHRQLKKILSWGIDVDEVDVNGRTALWYAIDAWVTRPDYEKLLIPAIKSLLQNGADTGKEDNFEISPDLLFARNEESLKLGEVFEEIKKEFVQ